MTTKTVKDTPKINGSQSYMNPFKVQTDTKRNPETVNDDKPSSKWFPRDLWTGLQSDMNAAKVHTNTKRNPETDFDDNLIRKVYPR